MGLKTFVIILLLTVPAFLYAQGGDCPSGELCPCGAHDNYYDRVLHPTNPISNNPSWHTSGDHRQTVTSIELGVTFTDGTTRSGAGWVCVATADSAVLGHAQSETGSVFPSHYNGMPAVHRVGISEHGCHRSEDGGYSIPVYAVIGVEECSATDASCMSPTVNWPADPICSLPTSYTQRAGVTGIWEEKLEYSYPFSTPKLIGPQAGPSPVVIPLHGGNFEDAFTNFDAGDTVMFKQRNTSTPLALSWIAAGAPYGFLALDRNGNGTIDSLGELFGNFTNQAADEYPIDPETGGYEPTGFRALAVYDRPDEGGNGDGVITKDDAIWSSLRVWEDTCHCGNSAGGVMHTLEELGITELGTRAERVGRKDKFGNALRFKSYIKQNGSHQTVYDVFFRAR